MESVTQVNSDSRDAHMVSGNKALEGTYLQHGETLLVLSLKSQ